VRWVKWENEAVAFKTVAGPEAVTPEKTKIHYPTTKSRVFSVVD
jgi:hypothetical protein